MNKQEAQDKLDELQKILNASANEDKLVWQPSGIWLRG